MNSPKYQSPDQEDPREFVEGTRFTGPNRAQRRKRMHDAAGVNKTSYQRTFVLGSGALWSRKQDDKRAAKRAQELQKRLGLDGADVDASTILDEAPVTTRVIGP